MKIGQSESKCILIDRWRKAATKGIKRVLARSARWLPPPPQNINVPLELVLSPSSLMLSHLRLLYRKTLLEIARELTRDEQKAFKFLCADLLPANEREANGMFEVFEKLTQIGVFSLDELSPLRELLDTLQRPDLIKSKVDSFEVKRELLFVLNVYVETRKRKRSEKRARRRSTYVAKLLVEEAEEKVQLVDLLTSIEKSGADVKEIVERFVDKTVTRKPVTSATVAMLLVFAGEVVFCASDSERERRLEEITQTLQEHLEPWLATHSGWVSWYCNVSNLLLIRNVSLLW